MKEDITQEAESHMIIVTGLAVFLVGSLLVVLVTVFRPFARDFEAALVDNQCRSQKLPPVAVILCLRGADPSLRECLHGLLRQRYTDYQVHIVFDHECDPAVEVAERTLRRFPNADVHKHVLESPASDRGLKVSAILQALEAIDARYRHIAFLVADATPRPDWLENLVHPLLADGIGASFGIRWFAPSVSNAGSLVRAQWNLFAISLMRYFNIPWGGSLAVNREALRHSLVTDRWSKTLCEDTCLGDTLVESGYTLAFSPRASMTNTETSTLAGTLGFVRRQLVFTRLHSRNWIPILVIGLLVATLPFVALGAAFIALSDGQVAAASVLGTLVLISHGAISLFEYGMCSLTGRLSPTDHGTKTGILRLYLAQILCSAVTALAFVGAAFARSVVWRGIRYELNARSGVRLVEYQPFQPAVPEMQEMSI